MALDAAQVEALQNSSQTDWAALNAQLSERSNWDANRFANDSKLHVRFFTKARLNQEKSIAENRPIYEDTEYIEIMMPGEKHNIIRRPVWDQDIQRFPDKYKLFKEGMTDQTTGTPLRLMPEMTDALAEELAYLKIRTVEHLANLNDNAMTFMGARELSNAAKRYLQKTTGAEAMIERVSELEAKLARMAELEATVLKMGELEAKLAYFEKQQRQKKTEAV